MIHNIFFPDICLHLREEVEGYSRKSQTLSEGVTVKAVKGRGLWRKKIDEMGNNNNDDLGEE